MPILAFKKSLPIFVISTAFLVLMLALNMFGGSSAAGVFLGETVRTSPIRRVDGISDKVALTFDVAYGETSVREVLEVLQKTGAKATFFIVGFWAEENSELTRAISEAGMEIGIYSNTYADFSKLTKVQMENEILEGKKVLESLTGKKHELFRFPFDKFSDDALKTAKQLNLQAVQWNVDVVRTNKLKETDIVARVCDKAKGGDIMRLSTGLDGAERLTLAIIEGLKVKNLQGCSVGDVVLAKDYAVDGHGTQKSTAK